LLGWAEEDDEDDDMKNNNEYNKSKKNDDKQENKEDENEKDKDTDNKPLEWPAWQHGFVIKNFSVKVLLQFLVFLNNPKVATETPTACVRHYFPDKDKMVGNTWTNIKCLVWFLRLMFMSLWQGQSDQFKKDNLLCLWFSVGKKMINTDVVIVIDDREITGDELANLLFPPVSSIHKGVCKVNICYIILYFVYNYNLHNYQNRLNVMDMTVQIVKCLCCNHIF